MLHLLFDTLSLWFLLSLLVLFAIEVAVAENDSEITSTRNFIIDPSSYKDKIVTWIMWWPPSLFWWLCRWPRKLFTALYYSVSGIFERIAANPNYKAK